MKDLNELKKEIPYKFKPQTCGEREAVMVAYIDARDVQDLLDDVCGPENWQTDYKVINDNLYAGIGIRIPVEFKNGGVINVANEWVWKYDCGVESNQEAEKGEASDAFKRAAVQWGIGRFLYRLGVVKLKTKDYKGKWKPATDEGKILWSNDEISEYIKNRSSSKPAEPKYAPPKEEPTYTKPAATIKEETLKKLNTLEKEGLKGKECIKKFLAEYNKSKGTNYKQADLNNDEKLTSVIDFINNIPPKV